jgi:hypothetical protein
MKTTTAPAPATEATTTTNDLRHGITIISGNERTTIKIRLNDECNNGHEDFSITADVDEKRKNGRWVNLMAGCCHDQILKLRPDLAPFVTLHLCTHEGLPMHSAANAFYWFAGFSGGLGQQYHGGSGKSGNSAEDCRRIFAEHIHATNEQVAAIVAAMPRTELELRAVLEDHGFIAQWKGEADAAIAMLEQWTGKKFKSTATRGLWDTVTPEQRAQIEHRRASGYYTPEQVAARDKAKAKAQKSAKLAEIRADLAKKIEKEQRGAQVALYMAERYFPRFRNFIYYTHSNTISFNWSSTEKLTTRDEFDQVVAEADRSALPEGIAFTFQDRPKY